MDSDIEYDGLKVIYKGLDIGVTREQLQDLDMMSIDYSFYLEEMYKQTTVYLRDMKLTELLSNKYDK